MRIGIFLDYNTAWWEGKGGWPVEFFHAIEQQAAQSKHHLLIFSTIVPTGTDDKQIKFHHLPSPKNDVVGRLWRLCGEKAGVIPTAEKYFIKSGVDILWYLQADGPTPEIMHVNMFLQNSVKANTNTEMLQRAASIVTNTEACKLEIVRHYRVPEERVLLVPLLTKQSASEIVTKTLRLLDDLGNFRCCWPTNM